MSDGLEFENEEIKTNIEQINSNMWPSLWKPS